jgi:tRNA threonylcarbamoyladenosine biosynthesis protein TsaB
LALLLNIDTATDTASVCISEEGVIIAYRENNDKKQHASFVHTAIDNLFQKSGKDLKRIDAISVTAGPGSYTGLRVGLATAKGFCFALGKPLITINTLKVMTKAALTEEKFAAQQILFCPMIDARRMEVFTALYNSRMETKLHPTAMLLENSTFNSWLQDFSIIFFGNGSEKFKGIASHKNASFTTIEFNAVHLSMLAEQAFSKKEFADVAYEEPTYVKEFFSTFKLS